MIWALSGLVVWAGILFPPALAIYALLKWEGRWRAAAAAPMAALVVFFVPLILDWQRDATAETLWGLIFVPAAMMLAIYSGGADSVLSAQGVAGRFNTEATADYSKH